MASLCYGQVVFGGQTDEQTRTKEPVGTKEEDNAGGINKN